MLGPLHYGVNSVLSSLESTLLKWFVFLGHDADAAPIDLMPYYIMFSHTIFLLVKKLISSKIIKASALGIHCYSTKLLPEAPGNCIAMI